MVHIFLQLKGHILRTGCDQVPEKKTHLLEGNDQNSVSRFADNGIDYEIEFDVLY